MFDENYFLVWGDEFSYDGNLDNSKWHHQIIPPNNGSWWNGEVQHYTNNSKNSFVSEGTMKIVAIKENYTVDNSTKNYTKTKRNCWLSMAFADKNAHPSFKKDAGSNLDKRDGVDMAS